MQFEKIRTINKRKIIVGGVISLGVISALIYLPSKAKYRTTESFNIVNGTINYRVPDLNVIAMYTIENEIETPIDTIPQGDYTINEKSICTLNGEKINTEMSYENGIVNIGITKKGTKCNIYLEPKTTESVITTLGTIEVKQTLPDFGKVATTNEGIFKTEDSIYGGTSYYWRGAVTNNYIKFANYCWRVIRINGDGSIRMIYDGVTCHDNGTNTNDNIAITAQKYNTYQDHLEYGGYTYILGSQRTLNGTASNLKTQTENWLSSHITGNIATKIADGKFCNDRNLENGKTWSSQPQETIFLAADERLYTLKSPTLNCQSGDIYSLKIGAITADEMAFAGGIFASGNDENKNYYLYNGQEYWSMTPAQWNKNTNNVNIFKQNSTGSISVSSASLGDYTAGGWSGIGIRPVINLRNDITITGKGTISNPYIVQ